MHNRIIDRLLDFLRSKNISAYSFEKKCMVANGYLKKQQRGKGTVGSEVLEKVHKNFPELDLMWLITGKGVMIKEEVETPELQLKEDVVIYNEAESIKSLQLRLNLLENTLADKQKIISLLESKVKE